MIKCYEAFLQIKNDDDDEIKALLLSAFVDALPASQIHNLLSSGNDHTGNWTKLFSMCFAV